MDCYDWGKGYDLYDLQTGSAQPPDYYATIAMVKHAFSLSLMFPQFLWLPYSFFENAMYRPALSVKYRSREIHYIIFYIINQRQQ